jgi:hypothetical protein
MSKGATAAGKAWPSTTVDLNGTWELVVGRAPVLAGWLTVCQLPLAERAVAGDPLCGALLCDLLNWAAVGSNERQR